MMGKAMPIKYGDPWKPILTVHIHKEDILDVLVDFGAAINVITFETMPTLGFCDIKPTPTIL